MYSNSLFATLNARKSVVGGLPDNSENNQHSGSVSLSRIRPRATEFPSQTPTTGVRLITFSSSYHHLQVLNAYQSFNERVLQIKVNTETTKFSDVKVSRLNLKNAYEAEILMSIRNNTVSIAEQISATFWQWHGRGGVPLRSEGCKLHRGLDSRLSCLIRSVASAPRRP